MCSLTTPVPECPLLCSALYSALYSTLYSALYPEKAVFCVFSGEVCSGCRYVGSISVQCVLVKRAVDALVQ